MYEVLAGNRVRKMPEMPTGEVLGVFEEYEEKLAKAPTYEISGSHNWKEGQLIEEGKDFLFHDLMDGVTDDGSEYTCRRYAIPSVIGNVEDEEDIYDAVRHKRNREQKEDELWSYVIEFIFLSDLSSEEKKERLKQHFTISRKPSSSFPSQLINKSK